MIYTANHKLPSKQKGCAYYFLAGSIDVKTPNPWRTLFCKNVKNTIHFFDPTRTDHDDLNDSTMQDHIHWELDALELSDKILLNFLPNSKSPISMIELGLYAKSGKLIVVCPNEFYQSRYIKTLCQKYKVILYNDLSDVNI